VAEGKIAQLGSEAYSLLAVVAIVGTDSMTIAAVGRPMAVRQSQHEEEEEEEEDSLVADVVVAVALL
jgi:hypothetical protein